MQVTKISAYSMKMVLRETMRGSHVSGYTVKPGFSDGLFIYSANIRGCYVGF